MEIVGNIKSYEWGKLGNESMVAQLAAENSSNFTIDTNSTYAELWMGDHPSGSSTIKKSGESLLHALPRRLPFLFKVLSIQKALSIQVHPNKSEAERLHKERPDIYKDPNHKPELAIALTPFKALCGFRPYNEIYNFCEQLPPLMQLLGGNASVAKLKSGSAADLKTCYERLMTAAVEDIKNCIDSIAGSYLNVLAACNLKDVFLAVNRDFPHDVGVLSLFFLNLLELKPGQAIFLAANEIHAYLSGDCIECMACSDNVVRAGLTPKYKDVQQLISCLNYEGSAPERKVFQPRCINDHVQLFVPPVKDFAVAQVTIPASIDEFQVQIKSQDSILLVLQGKRILKIKGQPDLVVKRGSIVYIPPEAAPEILLKSDNTNEEFIAYQAMENSFIN